MFYKLSKDDRIPTTSLISGIFYLVDFKLQKMVFQGLN